MIDPHSTTRIGRALRAQADARLTLTRSALVVALLAGCQTEQPPRGREPTIARMHEACVAAMVASTCQAMAVSTLADAAATVVIAGVGRVDARAYAELRTAGDAMCSVGKRACEGDWDGASCRSARALWAQAETPVTP